MMCSLGLQICSVRLSRRGKVSDEMLDLVDDDSSTPHSASFVEGCAEHCIRLALSLGAALVLAVRGAIDASKVVPFAVGRIAIYVVNLIERPLASHVDDRQSVCKILRSVDTDDAIAIRSAASSNCSRPSSAMPDSPCPHTRFRVVNEQFVESSMARRSDLFHAPV